MTPQERGPLDAYLALADPATGALPAGLAAAANQALHGIETVSLSLEALADALRAGGLPCTVEQLTERFNVHLRQAHDRARSAQHAIDVVLVTGATASTRRAQGPTLQRITVA